MTFRAWMSIFLILAVSFAADAQVKAPSVPQSAGRIDDALSITSIRVVIGHPDYGSLRQRLVMGRPTPPISATFMAKGGGLVSGHWELAVPSDGNPTSADIMATPMLTAAGRFAQRRFRQVGAFSFSLAPGDRYVLPGPEINPASMTAVGRYHVILRLDSVTSYSNGAAQMPTLISPVIFEVELPRTSPITNQVTEK